MTLTQNQQDYIDSLQAVFTAFKQSLVQALNVDNNSNSQMDIVREKKQALKLNAQGLQQVLGCSFGGECVVVQIQVDGNWGSSSGPNNSTEYLMLDRPEGENNHVIFNHTELSVPRL